MSLKGPILIIDDDLNDAEVMSAAIKEIGLPNEILLFDGGERLVAYLMTTTHKPFVILCDVRMPGLDGLSLRRKIVATPYLRRKSIPFIFVTGVVTDDIITEAYDLNVQGFFQKPGSYVAFREQLFALLSYWKRCLHPNAG